MERAYGMAAWNNLSQWREGRDLKISKQRETSSWNNLSQDKRTIPAQRASSYTALSDTDAQDENCGGQFWVFLIIFSARSNGWENNEVVWHWLKAFWYITMQGVI